MEVSFDFLQQLASDSPSRAAYIEKRRSASDRNTQTPGFVVASSALAPIVGSDSQPRVEAVQKLWTYIKFHNLQGSGADARYIDANESLLEVFGKARITMNEMSRVLKNHLLPTQNGHPVQRLD
jgi:upstream activation factor subunit UAF30